MSWESLSETAEADVLEIAGHEQDSRTAPACCEAGAPSSGLEEFRKKSHEEEES